MPTYQYVCTECGHEFEAFQNFSEDALSACPVCSAKLRKVYGSVGVVFKGSGFYRNDSRSATGGPKSAPDKEKAPAAGGGKSKESSTGSTPASTNGSPSSSSGSSGSGSGSGGSGSGGSGSGGSGSSGSGSGSSGSGSKASAGKT